MTTATTYNVENFPVPSEYVQMVLKQLEDARGWKYPVRSISCDNKASADAIAAGMDFYYGGHEMAEVVDQHGKRWWVVGSRGYYHYIGA
jgi:hypothetical protein